MWDRVRSNAGPGMTPIYTHVHVFTHTHKHPIAHKRSQTPQVHIDAHKYHSFLPLELSYPV